MSDALCLDDVEAQGEPGLPLALFRAIEAGTAHYAYRGIGCVKNPVDLAIMTRLLWETQPRSIIEVGSGEGGSALWMRDQVVTFACGSPCDVYSVDTSPPRCPAASEGLHFYRGDGRDLGAVFDDDFMRALPHPLLVVDDADHQPETTAGVLAFFDRWSRPGEYVVVEDGDCEKYYGGYNGGPLKAVRAFLGRRGGDYEIDRSLCDMFGLTFNPDGYIRRVR